MQASIQINVTPPRWLQTKTRRKAAALALATVLLIPGLAFAAHSFTDVPNSNTFHTQIGRVAGAGITAGCTATTYCPSANVTRGQMAAFLARSAGRVAVTEFGASIPAAEAPIGTVTIKAGDVTGGTAYVNIDVAAQTYTLAGGCPCDGYIYIRDDANVMLALGYYSLAALTGGQALDSTALSAVVSVPTGVSTTFTITAVKATTPATAASIFGTATATYLPFGADGTNAPAGSGPFVPAGAQGAPGSN